MRKSDRYKALIEYFSNEMPEPETELVYANSYQLLIAVILSAQCTDKRVNMITPALIERFPTPETLAIAHFDEVFPYIRSISYPNNKTKHIIGMAKLLVDEYDSAVPGTMEDLIRLPGVGRKTANVILNTAFGEPTIAVDTHIFRVAQRLGLAKGQTPLAVEQQLLKMIPEEYKQDAHHWLILHGRYICKARNPLCQSCFLADICPYLRDK